MNCCVCNCSFEIEGVYDSCNKCKQFVCCKCIGQKKWITIIDSCKNHTIVQCVGCQKNFLPTSWCTECNNPLCVSCVEKTKCIFDTKNKVFMTNKCSFHKNGRFNQSNLSSFSENILVQPPSYDSDLPPPYE